MKNIKIILITLITTIFLSGCVSSTITKAYNKMQVGKNKINGYSIDLRIYGKVNNKGINEIVRISNYMNKTYSITIPGKLDIKTKERTEDKVSYVKDNKGYIKNEAGTYEKTTKKIKYSNPLIYLEGIKNITKNSKSIEEKIGTNKYKVYDITIKKDYANKLLKEVAIEQTVSNNQTGKIYIDNKGYVYRVIYTIEDLTINANYYGIDNAVEITIR
jgi:hypothetical protein